MHNIFSMDLVAGDTWTQTSTNAKASLTAANLLSAKNNRAVGVLITCETQPVKYTYGDSDPVSDGLGHVLAAAGNVEIMNSANAKTFQFISSVASAHGVLQITPFFEPGR